MSALFDVMFGTISRYVGTILHDVGSNRDTTFRYFVGMAGPKNSIGR